MNTPLKRSPGPRATEMRVVATGLLVAMAALYLLTRVAGGASPAWGYVRAFAEAAMVGGLADWFAVTALFRHPLGLPIPHTAIIPRNKDRIGGALALFLRDNFLVPAVVARRMAPLDIAGAAGRFLATPRAAGTAEAGRLRRGAARLMADMLGALDQERLGGMVRSAVAGRLRALEIAPLAGQALEAAIAEDRHLPLLDALVGWIGRLLAANEETIRTMVSARSGAVLRWTGLDETLATKVVEGLYKLVDEMASDPEHPLRQRAEEGLANLAHDLRHDPAMRAKVEHWKGELLDNPAVAAWIGGLWEQARSALLRAARDPDAAIAGRLGEALRQLGATLEADPRLREAINQFARRATVGLAASYGDGIVRLVSDTVRGWDAATVTSRLENAVGRDLQYIRVNGTLVGGLVGLALHLVDRLL